MTVIDVIDRDELSELLGQVRLVEALPLMYFRKAHLPGALNIPLADVDELAPILLPDRDEPVVVYCFDEACPTAAAVGTRLVELGYSDVREYPGGKQDWLAAGLPTERGAPPQGSHVPHPRSHDDWKVDIASEQSFPASDPPSHSPLRP